MVAGERQRRGGIVRRRQWGTVVRAVWCRWRSSIVRARRSSQGAVGAGRRRRRHRMVRAGGGGQGRVVRAGGRRRVLQRRWQVAHRAIAGCAVWRHRVHAVCAAMRRRAGPRGAVAHKAQRHLHRAALLALALVIHRNLLAVGAGGAHARERHAPHADSLVGEHHVSLHDGQRHIVLVDDVEAERLIPYRVLAAVDMCLAAVLLRAASQNHVRVLPAQELLVLEAVSELERQAQLAGFQRHAGP
mmetsp:Transcript_31127/g.92784  ORF Transcript_31127/g.92784 Transcript_31127/m.92784 type:complete len:244 (+) Transcript_31127:480-1211(+)